MNICAVIVTHNSAQYIERLLQQLLNQSIKFSRIIIVDTASNDNTVRLCQKIAKKEPIINIFPNEKNIGGAGGFRQGLEQAIQQASDYIITFDDDSQVLDKYYLEKLVAYAQEYQLNVTGSLIVDSDNNEKTAFNYLINRQPCSNVEQIRQNKQYCEELKLFNGALFEQKVIKHLKGPNPNFFIRGDEEDFRLQIIRSGYRVATCIQSIVYHPQSITEKEFYLGENIYYIKHLGKQYFSTRNRYYMFTKQKKPNSNRIKWTCIFIKHFLRYSLFYLFRKYDFVGYVVWFRAFIDGLSENLTSTYAEKIKKQYFN